MPDAPTLAVFTAAALGLIVVPRPAVVYVVSQSVDGGRRAGLVSVLGVRTDGLIHVASAARAVVAAALVRYGVRGREIRRRGLPGLPRRQAAPRQGRAAEAAGVERTWGDLFRRGVLVQVLNPKTALCFFAFLPQFVDADGAPAAVQLASLGGAFIALALLSDGAYAVAAGTLADRLRDRRVFRGVQRWLSGTVLVGLSALAARART